MTKSKKVAAVFRVVIILTAVAAITCMGQLFRAALEFDDILDENAISMMTLSVNCYYLAFIGCVVSLVLSVIAQAHCRKVSVVFRTVVLGVVTGFLAASLEINRILRLCLKLIKEYGENELRFLEPEDVGITSAQLDEIQNFIDSEDKALMYVLGVLTAAILLCVLAFTSIHWFAKNK